jgi:predicted esterase
MKSAMLKLFIFLALFFIPVKYSIVVQKNASIELGDHKATKTWVYLCGLVSDFQDDSVNRGILDKIGKKLHIKIVAVSPEYRSPNYNNMLNWPLDNLTDIIQTYDYIKKVTKEYAIDGLIGFSNGGFFLNELMQQVPIEAPIITIGAGGIIHANPKYQPTSLILIIGKKDTYHYKCAIDFVNQAKAQSINIKLVEHIGGHIIPATILENVLNQYIKIGA